jgi:hypothetical protein
VLAAIGPTPSQAHCFPLNTGKDGECTKMTRDGNSLTINMLKGFEGINDPAVTKDLLQKVLDHKCVLAQNKDYQELPLVSTLTRSYKVQRELRKVILKYYLEKYRDKIGNDCTWEELIKDIPSLDTEEELTQIK